jgi:hypothetical protein
MGTFAAPLAMLVRTTVGETLSVCVPVVKELENGEAITLPTRSLMPLTLNE